MNDFMLSNIDIMNMITNAIATH